jgi:hypothetical protein
MYCSSYLVVAPNPHEAANGNIRAPIDLGLGNELAQGNEQLAMVCWLAQRRRLDALMRYRGNIQRSSVSEE